MTIAFWSTFLLLGCIVLLPVPPVHSARILAIYPSFIRSHLTVSEGILEELAAREHEVSAIDRYLFSQLIVFTAYFDYLPGHFDQRLSLSQPTR